MRESLMKEIEALEGLRDEIYAERKYFQQKRDEAMKEGDLDLAAHYEARDTTLDHLIKVYENMLNQ